MCLSHNMQTLGQFFEPLYNKKMQEWYDEANIEKKKEVEDFRQKSKDDLLEGGDDPNRLFQE